MHMAVNIQLYPAIRPDLQKNIPRSSSHLYVWTTTGHAEKSPESVPSRGCAGSGGNVGLWDLGEMLRIAVSIKQS